MIENIHVKLAEKEFDFPDFKQNNYNPWSNITYRRYGQKNDIKEDAIAETGCGPTSLASIVSGLLRGAKVLKEAKGKLREEIKEYNNKFGKGYEIEICELCEDEMILYPDEAVAMATLTHSKEKGLGAGSYDEVFANIVNKYFSSKLQIVSVNKKKLLDIVHSYDVLVAHTSAVHRDLKDQHRSIFTAYGHYMAILGFKIVDGTEYLIIEDPYEQIHSNIDIKSDDFIKPNLYKYEAVIDTNRGNCDRFWAVKLK